MPWGRKVPIPTKPLPMSPELKRMLKAYRQVQISRAEIAKRLEGNWRQELIFVLQQEMKMYDIYQRRVAECDQELQKHLRAFGDTVSPPMKEALPPKKNKKQKKQSAFPSRRGTTAHHRSGSDAHRWRRCDDRANGHQ
jgi:hypothetical protein